MKKFLIASSIAVFVITMMSFKDHLHRHDNPHHRDLSGSVSEDPWSSAQLLAPGDLAKTLSNPQAKQPFVFCIGPGALIKGSLDIGPTRDSVNIVKFRKELSQLPKDASIVIYCGCCPFVHCPNIRPAFALLNEMKFTHPQLLNLEHNLKIDWIDKGYPATK